MKNIYFILLISLSIIVIQSCKKPPLPAIEDPIDNTGGGSGGTGEEEKPSPYVGTWKYTKIDFTEGVLAVMGNAVGTFTGSGKDIVGEVILTENPNRYTTSLKFTANIRAEFAGQSQLQEAPVGQQNSSGTWEETASGEIKLIDDNGTDLNIVSSTSNKIVFTGDFTTKIPAQFFEIDATSEVRFTLEK